MNDVLKMCTSFFLLKTGILIAICSYRLLKKIHFHNFPIQIALYKVIRSKTWKVCKLHLNKPKPDLNLKQDTQIMGHVCCFSVQPIK